MLVQTPLYRFDKGFAPTQAGSLRDLLSMKDYSGDVKGFSLAHFGQLALVNELAIGIGPP